MTPPRCRQPRGGALCFGPCGIESEAGGTAAAHRGVVRARAAPERVDHLTDHRLQRHGRSDAATHAAIRDYQHMAGLKETGEPSKALFESLKEMRDLMAPKPKAAETR